MAKDARQVAVTPKRCSNGCVQWVPARTATPARSITVATSWAWAPSMLKETMAPLFLALPKMRKLLISESRSVARSRSAA